MVSQFTYFVMIIIAAADQARAHAATQQLPNSVPADAVNTFATPLSPTGTLPATHYWAAGAFRPAAYTKLQQMVPLFPGSVVVAYDPSGDPGFPDRQLASLGLQRVSVLPGR